MKNQITSRAATNVEQLFRDKLSDEYRFHDLEHTASVRKYARQLGEMQELSDIELEILDLAAIFHDTGYTEIYTGHEEVSMTIAKDFLSKENYDQKKIQQILDCILATKTGITPQTNLQKILKDADLSNLGLKTFFEHSDNLRYEWEVICDSKYTDLEWLKNNYEFLSAHQFYTIEAKSLWDKRKKKNLRKMEKQIDKVKKKT